MKHILKLTRPYQWVKNAFVFMPLFFGGALTNTQALIGAVIAFFAFSFIASSIYCYNDIIDVEADRKHSEKCKRPIASGAVSVPMGYFIMVAMVGLSAFMVFLLKDKWAELGGVIAFYFIMEIAYCRIFKRYAIIDVFILSLGFVLRILAGSASTGIVASHWLVLMTFLLSLLLSFAKRRDDVVKMIKTGEAPRHNTDRYNMTFINQSITITAAITVVCYIMYTLSPEVMSRSNSHYVYLTTILVLLGLMRYLQRTLVDEKSGDPTKLLYTDHFLQLVIALWFASYLFILYL